MDHIIPTTEFKGQEFLDQSKIHFKADQLIKGTYGKMNGQFKGCSIGCHMHHIDKDFKGQEYKIDSGLHKAVAHYYRYPEWIACIQEWIFENLPEGENRKWHVELAQALYDAPQPIDWQTLLHKTHIAILDVSYTVAGKSKDVVRAAVDLHQRAVDSDVLSDADWLAVERSASNSAKRSDKRSAERYAALSAADSAVWPEAESAAWSAERVTDAWSIAWTAPRTEAAQIIRDVFLASIRSQVPA